MKIRYGVLSTAQIARNQHIPAAQRSDVAEIIAISSRDPAKAKHYAKELDVPRAYGSYDEILQDPDIDAVINPLPNAMHCAWTIKAAESGKHILCEKPLAVTVEEAERMIDAANANGVLLMEGFTTQFQPLFPYVLETITAGKIGDVTIVRSELTYTIQDWANDSRVKPELAGGALLDAGCYCVNAIRTVMEDEPVSVQAYEHVREWVGVESTFVGLMQFPGDRVAYMATGMEQPFRALIEVIGTKGRIEVPMLFSGTEVRVVAGGETHVESFEAADRFRLQLDHFSTCILKGRAPKLPPSDGLRNTAVLVALKRAAEEGHAVEV
jgi:predicted dehydrogenase